MQHCIVHTQLTSVPLRCSHMILQSSRQELIQDVDELKKKITGAAEE